MTRVLLLSLALAGVITFFTKSNPTPVDSTSYTHLVQSEIDGKVYRCVNEPSMESQCGLYLDCEGGKIIACAKNVEVIKYE